MTNIKSEMMPSDSKGVEKWTLRAHTEYKLGASCWAHSGNTNSFPGLVISAAHSTLRVYSEEIIKDGHIGLCSRIIYRY